MNAIELLRQQHDELKDLFEQYESLDENDFESRREIVREVADLFAIHTALEERHFYPASKSEGTQDLLNEAVAEHTAAKRLIADILTLQPDDPRLDPQMKVLHELIENHVEEEEDNIFPQVEQLLDSEELDDLGEQMQNTMDEIEDEGSPGDMLSEQADLQPPV